MTRAPVELVVRLDAPEPVGAEAARRPAARLRLALQGLPGTPAALSPAADDRFESPLEVEVEELRWYLERWASWPSEPLRERVEDIESRIGQWGRDLWSRVESAGHPDILRAWRQAGEAGHGRQLTIVVDERAGDLSPVAPEPAAEAASLLLALPWELLHDGESFLLQSANGARIRRCREYRGEASRARGQRSPLRILIISPRPIGDGIGFFDHRISARPLLEALQGCGEAARVDLVHPPTFRALERALLEADREGFPYQVLHFDGHGTFASDGGQLLFEHELDTEDPEQRLAHRIAGDRLAELVSRHRISTVFLEACHSAQTELRPDTSLAIRLLDGGVTSVVAMTHGVLIETSRVFVEAFYRQLVSGSTIGEAVMAGQLELAERTFRRRTFAGDLHLIDWFVPVLYQSGTDIPLVETTDLREQPAPDRAEALTEPAHGFIGRSRELLALERLLLRERFAVVVGVGGEGKTALACELARWFLLTRRARHVVFVSLEAHRFVESVLHAVGSALRSDFVLMAASDPDAALELVDTCLESEPTLIVVDNCESVIAMPREGDEGPSFDSGVERRIFALLERWGRLGQTKLIFTSRTPLPEPFDGHHLELGRLDRDAAITVVSNALREAGLRPGAPEEAVTEDVVFRLVDAVGGHARSLVALTGEVASRGVEAATSDIRALMASLAEKFPDDRERSLFASIELSLRRLPRSVRAKLDRLCVFSGGGHGYVISRVLGMDNAKEAVVELGNQLIDVGLADHSEDSYLTFHPALAPYLLRNCRPDQLGLARQLWVEGTIELVDFLYLLRTQEPRLVAQIVARDLENLRNCLGMLVHSAAPEAIGDYSLKLEALVSGGGYFEVAESVRAVRESAEDRLESGCESWATSKLATIDGLLLEGDLETARALLADVDRRLVENPEGISIYLQGLAHLLMGRALSMNGQPSDALDRLESAGRRFREAADTGEYGDADRMILAVRVETAVALAALGQHSRAIELCREAIREPEMGSHDKAAIHQILGNSLASQKLLEEAAAAFDRAREEFERLGETKRVVETWRALGDLFRDAARYEEAEAALQRALAISISSRDLSGEASALNQLGNLYATMKSYDRAIQFHRRAISIHERLGDEASESRGRSSLAGELWKLGRLDEARLEIDKALRSKSGGDSSLHPWNCYAILEKIERDSGDELAGRKARSKAIELYYEYRHHGGEPIFPGVEHCRLVGQAIADRDEPRIEGMLLELRQRRESDKENGAFLAALQEILEGNRGGSATENPDLHFSSVAELRLLLQELAVLERAKV